MNLIKSLAHTIILLNILQHISLAQAPPENAPVNKEHSFPEIKGYIGIVHPLYTFASDVHKQNFTDYYTFGNPWGINIWKSKKVGFTFEFTPFIRHENNVTKVNNYLFHPGIIYRLPGDFMVIGRLAYETSGRFGFTPILNKIIKRYPTHNFFAAILFPTRFGNDRDASVTVAFQFGVGF